MFPGKLKINLNFILYHSEFAPDRAIVGIPSCIQRRPPEKQRKANLALYFYKAACRLNSGIVLLINSQFPRLKIVSDMAANELTI